MEGKMPLFHVPVRSGYKNTASPHPLLQLSSTSEPSKTQACKNRSATESEETQMAISYTTAQHVCVYSNVPTRRKMYTRSVYAPVECAHLSSSLLTCGQPTHLCFGISFDPCPAFMCLLIACVYSQTSWETDCGGWVRERATGTQQETEKKTEREEEIKELSLYFCVKVGIRFLQYNLTDRQRQTNICFWAISANHSQSGSYLNIDECFPPYSIKPYQNRPEWATADGKRG